MKALRQKLSTLPLVGRISRRRLTQFSVVAAIIVTANLADFDDTLYRLIADNITPQEYKNTAVWLNGYQLDINGLEMGKGVDEISGLTWSGNTQTLFAVMNKPSRVAELSSEGQLLRTITLDGFEDVEGITWAGDDSFLIADERRQSVVQVSITPETEMLSYNDNPRIALGINAGKNKGFEGVAWQQGDANVWVAKERDPMTLYRINGFTNKGVDANIQIDLAEDINTAVSWDNSDLSGLHFDNRSGNLLVLSDQSALLTEMSLDGEVVSSLGLGLISSVPGGIRQPEGVTMDDEGNVYIVSEPNLLYRFTPGEQGTAARGQAEKTQSVAGTL